MFADFGPLARAIALQKYSHEGKEDWPDIAKRQRKYIVDPYLPELGSEIERAIVERKFLPGGRYLYAAGRKFQQVNNCFLHRAEDSRQGWSELGYRVRNGLMTGGGIGVSYELIRPGGYYIAGMGGESTGPLALMNMTNEEGRYIRQGGSRRSAVWAGLPWWHPDVFKFIEMKNWPDWLMKQKQLDFNTPCPMDGTNISVQLDDDFFAAYSDPNWSRTYNKWSGQSHTVDHSWAKKVYWRVVTQMLTTAEPGFSIDCGEHSGETLRNAPVHGDTLVLVNLNGSDITGSYVPVKSIVGKEVLVWTRYDWVPTTFTLTRKNSPTVIVHMSNGRFIRCSPDHEFITDLNERVPAGNLRPGQSLMVALPYGVQKATTVTSVISSLPDDVFCCDVKVEEHSFCAEGVIISNCTEVVSADDSDLCNLGSINMSRVKDIEEFTRLVELGTAFLVCGTLASALPYDKLYQTRNKNRRLGLGLMGVHEWLIKRGKKYGPDEELGKWLNRYKQSGFIANKYCDRLSISRSIATRAIAPNGTIGICAETTTSGEPLEAVAYLRRYLKGDTWFAQYCITPTAHRLIKEGINPDSIETAYTLAENVERRIEFQAWLQSYVDQAISSTINLPAWGSSCNNESTIQHFGDTLFKYLPKLRGITAYPDGCRYGQPITPVPYAEAINKAGVEFEDNRDISCVSGVCGA